MRVLMEEDSYKNKCRGTVTKIVFWGAVVSTFKLKGRQAKKNCGAGGIRWWARAGARRGRAGEDGGAQSRQESRD